MAKKGDKTPVQAIRIYLLKTSVKQYSDALRDDIECDEYDLAPATKLDGKLFLRKPIKRKVKWAEFLQQGIQGKIPPIYSLAHAAVLFLKTDGRLFALVFGMGRYLLKDTAYEADFGILSALNSVNPEEIRSADTFQFEAVAVHKRTQTSRSTSLGDFEIDAGREHFRSIAGISRTKDLAERISGTEGGLGTNVRVKFSDLGSHCSKVLKAYRAKSYKDAFPRFENLRRVSDKAKVAKLEEKLITRLRKKQISGIYLSPPEPIEYDDFAGFSLSPKGEVLDELEIGVYLATRKDLSTLDLEKLKRDRIFLRKETVDEPLEKWTVYKSLICEFKEGNHVYVLMSGEWLRISASFAGEVKQVISQIPEVDVGLPVPNTAKTEPEYLSEVERHGGGLIVLDRKLAYCEESGHPIEICDVLTKKREFVHVKRKEGGSASLSHLFLQGKNSALALIRDGHFRKKAREHLKPFGTTAVSRVPKSKPKLGSFKVIYAVMGKFKGTVVDDLPFFSKLSLMSVAQELGERGIEVGGYED
ncbi:MAG: hypothetical protein KatS3mg105_4943 [Gemmatales bacterium]|nr:MAG: hypothetical protein KatS3mg105_4943 [Gemmatales bacterium]